jgi:hypothetical protein
MHDQPNPKDQEITMANRSSTPKSKSVAKAPEIIPPTDYASRICAAWNKTLEGIFECGDLLVEAKAKLAHGKFAALIESGLPFGKRTAQMLMAIANDKRLRDANFSSHLPPSWHSLYAISRLKDNELNEAISRGLITSEITQADANELSSKVYAVHHTERVKRMVQTGMTIRNLAPAPDREPGSIRTQVIEPEREEPNTIRITATPTVQVDQPEYVALRDFARFTLENIGAEKLKLSGDVKVMSAWRGLKDRVEPFVRTH